MMKTMCSVSLFLLCLFDVFSGTAAAHRVNVFAYVIGDTVHVESNLSGGKHVKGGKVVVTGGQGRVVASGLTDENGRFSFRVSERTDLTVLLIAGQGHRAKWVVRESELADLPAKTPPVSGVGKPEPPQGTILVDEPAGDVGHSAPATPVRPEALEAMIEAVLDRKLKPIAGMLADCRQESVRPRDVFGGLGYIFGLMGVAAYIKYRMKRS